MDAEFRRIYRSDGEVDPNFPKTQREFFQLSGQILLIWSCVWNLLTLTNYRFTENELFRLMTAYDVDEEAIFDHGSERIAADLFGARISSFRDIHDLSDKVSELTSTVGNLYEQVQNLRTEIADLPTKKDIQDLRTEIKKDFQDIVSRSLSEIIQRGLLPAGDRYDLASYP